ncbi:chromo domain-containing protein cec-3 isoform X2 [Drosophila rhopaloa]|uniref:Chromo domain-containing protein cec-3 isoform X2 n=1 Tax=Drosophila rhopaloa TaxID=1041015 RepID=A0A6P4ENC3_DRORH|nr:chromo domain-containing protein cec-3 isoform X2 [Drosophila rhopaloa]
MSGGGHKTTQRHKAATPPKEYVVEKIVGKRYVSGRPQLLIKWVDFPDEENTWEPMENLGNCVSLVTDFEAELFRRLNVQRQREISAELEKDLEPSPATSGLQATPKLKQAKKESYPNNKGKPEIGKQADPIATIKNLPKTYEEMPSCSRASDGSREICNRQPPDSPTWTVKIPIDQLFSNDLDLSESSDDDTPLATALFFKGAAGSPKQETPKASNPRKLVPVVQELTRRRETDLAQNSNKKFDSDMSSCSSTISICSVTSLESLSSVLSLSEDEENKSLAALKDEAIKLETVAKFGGLVGGNEALPPENTKPNISIESDECLGQPNRKQKLSINIIDENEDSIDSELERQSNLNFPVPVMQAPGKEKKDSQSSMRRMSQTKDNEDVAMLLLDQQQITEIELPGCSDAKKDIKKNTSEDQQASNMASATSFSGRKGSKSRKKREAWRVPERKAPFGLSRGLELEKVHHSFRVRDHFFLFVTWKGCSIMDAVLIEEIKDLYPTHLIEYFESLKIVGDDVVPNKPKDV